MPVSPDQAELIAAFEEGRVEGVAVSSARIDTHISHVFLGRDRAWKLKRAVQLPFLDFSTIALRQAACLAEMEANRPLAAPMYLGVEPVVALGKGLYRIGGDGEAADWVVVMKRFDQADQFDELVDAGRLTPELVDETADVIAGAHSAAPPVRTAGHTADYRSIIHELQAAEAHGAEELGIAPGDPAVFSRLDTELARIDPLIEARRKSGKVQRTHGDLHLRNICLFEGRPTPFDALEFDARMATTDRLYDLAFLLMDLVRSDHPEIANRLMNRYWGTSGEAEAGLAVLPFFMALRAAVRFAIAVEAGKLAEAAIYRALSLRILSPGRPALVCMGGLSGVGKSTIARALAPYLPGPAGARLLRSDVLRKRAVGHDLESPLDPAAYSAGARSAVYDKLFAHGLSAFETGASVILDATFQSADMRGAACSLAEGRATGIWLEAPLDVRLDRIAQRKGDVSDAHEAVARAQEAPETLEPCWCRIDASGEPADTVRRVLAALASR